MEIEAMALVRQQKLDSPERTKSSIDIPSTLAKALPKKIITKIKSISTLNSPGIISGESMKTLSNNMLVQSSQDLNDLLLSTQPAIPGFDITKFKYLKPIPTLTYETEAERKEMKQLNPVYYKNNKIDIVPKIATSKFRRRFGVDPDKLKTKNMNMDSEHLNLESRVFVNSQSSLALIAREFNIEDTDTVAQVETKPFNDISSIVEERLKDFKEEIKEECSCFSSSNNITEEDDSSTLIINSVHLDLSSSKTANKQEINSSKHALTSRKFLKPPNIFTLNQLASNCENLLNEASVVQSAPNMIVCPSSRSSLHKMSRFFKISFGHIEQDIASIQKLKNETLL